MTNPENKKSIIWEIGKTLSQTAVVVGLIGLISHLVNLEFIRQIKKVVYTRNN